MVTPCGPLSSSPAPDCVHRISRIHSVVLLTEPALGAGSWVDTCNDTGRCQTFRHSLVCEFFEFVMFLFKINKSCGAQAPQPWTAIRALTQATLARPDVGMS